MVFFVKPVITIMGPREQVRLDGTVNSPRAATLSETQHKISQCVCRQYEQVASLKDNMRKDFNSIDTISQNNQYGMQLNICLDFAIASVQLKFAHEGMPLIWK